MQQSTTASLVVVASPFGASKNDNSRNNLCTSFVFFVFFVFFFQYPNLYYPRKIAVVFTSAV